MLTDITLERASELVQKLGYANPFGMDAIDLFCHFEQILNPYIKLGGEFQDLDQTTQEKCAKWQQMFAAMCGFVVATDAELID